MDFEIDPAAAEAAQKASAAASEQLDIIVPSTAPDATLEQRQLAEFNEWVRRYNTYQHQLESYWRERLAAEGITGKGSGAAKSRKGNVNKDKWFRRYEELLEFKEEHGHTNVPSQYTFKLSPPLGEWVKRMRREFREDKLTSDRKKLLEDVGFEFEKVKGGEKRVVFSKVWNKVYLELCDYRDEHGNIEVPDNYKHTPESSCNLDLWIKRQRTAFKTGKLDNDLIQRLEEVGIDLAGRARPFGYEIDAEWTASYKQLKKLGCANGVPEGNPELADWVDAQRNAYAEGELNEHQIGMLNGLGFNFFTKGPAVSDDPWDTRFSELKAYHEANGDTNVPRYFPLNLALGEFVHNLRAGYQHGSLTEGRKKKLQELGFTFVKNKGRKKGGMTKWDMHYEELKRYKAKHGTTNIPDSDKDNAILAAWVKNQKRYHRDKTLKKDRLEKLKGFGFDFGAPVNTRTTWDSNFQELVKYKEEHGHVKIPSTYAPNNATYFWIGTQRQAYKKGKLSQERIEKLTELGVDLVIDKPRDRPKGITRPAFLDPNEWERCYANLVKYKNENGDCNVPQREEKDRLGSFVQYMRYYHRLNKLSDEQVKKLTDIGFSFSIIDNRWSEKYDELVAYHEANGDTNVPLDHKLYPWCMYQRQSFKNNTLVGERIDLLRKIDFKLEGSRRGKKSAASEGLASPGLEKADREEYLSQMWDRSYQELVEYANKVGNCKVPVNYTANPSLGAWVFAQKVAHKKGKLSGDHAQKLLEIGFDLGGK